MYLNSIHILRDVMLSQQQLYQGCDDQGVGIQSYT